MNPTEKSSTDNHAGIDRSEFSDWIISHADELPEETKDSKAQKRRYYVYVLCEKTKDGKMIPFYIGKGTGGRVWNHSDDAEKEKEELRKEAKKEDWSEEELEDQLKTVREKHKKINMLGEERISRIIVKAGLTEYEAFMCESALINIFKLKGLTYSDDVELTNLVNGHSNVFEKTAEIRTAAMPVEQYYEYCKKPIIINQMEPKQEADLKGKKILLQNIESFYKDCVRQDLFPTPEARNEAVRESVRGFWDQGDPDKMDYVFAMFRGRITGVYKVKKTICERTKKAVFYTAFDLWDPNFPKYDALPGRKKDYDMIKPIYDDLLAQGILKENQPAAELSPKIRGTLYSRLGPAAQESFRKSIIEEDYNCWISKYRKKNKTNSEEERDLYEKFKKEYYGWKNTRYAKWIKEKQKKDPQVQDSETTRRQFFDAELRKWTIRKYFVLEEISPDADPDFKRYLNCRVLEKRDDGYKSVFAPKVNKKGNKSRPPNYIYLPRNEKK